MKSEYKDEFKVEYVPAYEPDLEQIAAYVLMAKGISRNMAEFALACEVSASTLSRIANKKVTRRISTELAQAIIKNAAKESGVTYSAFMKANGMVPKHEVALPMGITEKYEYLANKQKSIVSVKNTLWMELSSQGYSARYVDSGFLWTDERADSKYGLREVFSSISQNGKYHDFVLELSKEQESQLHWFILDFAGSDNETKEQLLRGNVPFAEMEDFARLFLVDIWEPERMKDLQISFVFINPEAFDLFEKVTKDIEVHTPMSRVLIDPEKLQIIKETKFLSKN